MTSKRWVFITLISLTLLGASFFFFLGAFFSLFSPQGPRTGNVAVVEVLGGIFDSKPIIETLRDLKKDDSVKAVVLRIDSPGGSVSASQEIFEAVKEFKAVKPIVASMGTVAASGGYYIAAPTSKIVANPGTITGSIGVRLEMMNVQDLLAWARLKPVTLKSGIMKDVGSATRPMTQEERDYLEGILKAMHLQFKKAVAESRNIPLEELETFADGRVLTGEEALSKRLVDELGSQEKAVKAAADLAGLTEEPEVFYPKLEGREFLDYLMNGLVDRLFDKVAKTILSPFYLTL